jgi:hypothetical protein
MAPAVLELMRARGAALKGWWAAVLKGPDCRLEGAMRVGRFPAIEQTHVDMRKGSMAHVKLKIDRALQSDLVDLEEKVSVVEHHKVPDILFLL